MLHFGRRPTLSLSSSSFTTTQPDSLPVLLQFRDQCVALFDNVGILLILVVRPVRLDDAADSVYRTRYSISGDELGQIAVDGKTLA